MKNATGPRPEAEKIPARGLYTEAARLERLSWASDRTGADLRNVESTRLDAARLTGNIENFIGAVEVPVGLAGPLLFAGREARGAILAPFATSEGAVVASATRGATAISRSGGVTTRTVAQRMMRVPLFVLSSVQGAIRFADWVREHLEDLRLQTQMVSRHARLISAEPTLLGKMAYVTFLYETGDAAGQNMTTSCTWHACQWLMQQIQKMGDVVLEHFQIESNASGDKKVTFQSFTAGRGIRVVAECVLDRRVMQEVLKVTPEQALHTYSAASVVSTNVGMVGFNFNIANVIAAVFTATGQDIACVHECSLGQLSMSLVDGDLWASLLLPGLIVGTVGGGTHLPAQQAMLQLMGCHGTGKVQRLAEIIAGFCLSLELSTLAAVTSGQFASAHEKLGRNRPVRWLTQEELTPAFFEPGLRESLGDPGLRCESVAAEQMEMGSSILTELTARKVNKLIGHYPLRLGYDRGDGEKGTLPVVVKIKPLDEEVMLMTNSIAQSCGGPLAAAYGRFRRHTGFAGCHTRELGVYEQRDPRFVEHAPRIYGTYRDPSREAFVVVMERLDDLLLMNSAEDVSGWGVEHIESAVRGIAQVHGVWYGREEALLRQPWLGPIQTTQRMVEMSELWDALLLHGATEFPELLPGPELDMLRALIPRLPQWWGRLEQMPRTLIHNDFNPRNIGLRRGDRRLCAYDWELATLHVPQRDLAELLCFVLTDASDRPAVGHYVELHRRTLMEACGCDIDAAMWRAGFLHALRDFCINRMSLYLMGHTVRRYTFMNRVCRTALALLRAGAEQEQRLGSSSMDPSSNSE